MESAGSGAAPARRELGRGAHFPIFPGIKRRWRAPADHLSGGEQQDGRSGAGTGSDTRVTAARQTVRIWRRDQNVRGFDRFAPEISIITVDHHLDLALALSDRTVALETGQVTHIGPSARRSTDLDMRRKVLWYVGAKFVIPSAARISLGHTPDRDSSPSARMTRRQ